MLSICLVELVIPPNDNAYNDFKDSCIKLNEIHLFPLFMQKVAEINVIFYLSIGYFLNQLVLSLMTRFLTT